MMRYWVGTLLLLCTGFAYSVGINMSGTLLVISCSVNNDKPVEVDFGNAVGIKKVDGVRYRQPIPLEIKCSRPPGDLLHLVFAGTATDFERSALVTGNKDLGIRLLQDETPIEVNQPLSLDENALPKFSAVPIKRPDHELVAGEFNALAHLQIQFN